MYLLPLVVILGVVTDVLLIVILILVLKIIREDLILKDNHKMIRFDWFKQSFGQKPLRMASSLYVGQDSDYSNNFIKDFTETKRLGLESNSMSVLQQPVSESVQLGDSVTLNCTIHTETCVGEQSVYWFRHGSGVSRQGIIYTHGNSIDQCEKFPNAGSPTQSCVYNLPKRNLSLSDAGTYYCAVASCGEILFGNGTKLDIDHGCKEDHLLFMYFLGVALGLCVILIIVLTCVLYKMSKCTGSSLFGDDYYID
ncbi:uncharacterized protein LOC121572584 [Coregonus clupeaformis]|uniref:uncharacterized protein LOC121572584 n=1 Tax=Coregonus clupeaformis TaxID=59861 RepID=UPI001E1C7933|nr:uncharacterized protein LOC121572584 [Coregonus clupeaformis]